MPRQQKDVTHHPMSSALHHTCDDYPVIHWFRRDLRLHDNPALLASLQSPSILPVACLPLAEEPTSWGFARVGPHRDSWHMQALEGLDAALRVLGSRLLVLWGAPEQVLPALARAAATPYIRCEAIDAPEEQSQVQSLRAQGLAVDTVWQSSMLDPQDMPFEPSDVPDVFTDFRRALERARVTTRQALAAPTRLPPWPDLDLSPLEPIVVPQQACTERAGVRLQHAQTIACTLGIQPEVLDSSFPLADPAWSGSEASALTHLSRYMQRGLPKLYKATRNALQGQDFSSKFSSWLATGALSARRVCQALRAFEAQHGPSEGSHWLWVELLWRDYFRFIHTKHGRRLYGRLGLSARPPHGQQSLPRHDPKAFDAWRAGQTGQPLVDAGMRELAATGYLSNRMRQIVASYLIHDLACDWRAGAAWFEHHLIDFDTHSNHGNWLYIAGHGTDPRGGRRFNPEKQTREHDPDGSYRRNWACSDHP